MYNILSLLSDVRDKQRPYFLMNVVQRYIPIMKGQFGDQDDDVLAIEVSIANWQRTVNSC